MLMPYWDFRLDLQLNNPQTSRIFEMIALHENATYENAATVLNANFKQILEADEVEKFFDRRLTQGDIKRAIKLARHDETGILHLLLMVSMELGLGEVNSTECTYPT